MSNQHDEQGDVALDQETRVEKPRRFKVIFHNDDFTTMEFVVRALELIYHHSPAQAAQIMLEVHRSGHGIAGVFTREVAETKVFLTRDWARQEGHPLMVTMEPE